MEGAYLEFLPSVDGRMRLHAEFRESHHDGVKYVRERVLLPLPSPLSLIPANLAILIRLFAENTNRVSGI